MGFTRGLSGDKRRARSSAARASARVDGSRASAVARFDPSAHELGIEPQRLTVFGNAAGDLSGLLQRVPQVLVKGGSPRVELHRASQLGERPFEVLRPEERGAEIRMGSTVVRIDANARLVFGYRLLGPTVHHEGGSEVSVARGAPGIDLDRSCEAAQGFVGMTCRQEGDRELRVRFGLVGQKARCLAERFNRSRRVPEQEQSAPQLDEPRPERRGCLGSPRELARDGRQLGVSLGGAVIERDIDQRDPDASQSHGRCGALGREGARGFVASSRRRQVAAVESGVAGREVDVFR